MPELERELRALGALVDFPPTPDLVPAVRARIAGAPRARPFAWRRAVVVALAALVVAVAGALAVPSARSAILEWLGLRGVTIERVPEQPPPAPGGDLSLGEEVTLAEARSRARFDVLVPGGLGAPDTVYVSSDSGVDGYVSLVYASEGRVDLLVTQFRARIEEDFLEKLVGPGTTVTETRVDGARGYWVAGAPHEIFYLDEDGNVIADTARLAENTLLWQRGAVTYRIEGADTLEEALEVARSMR